MAHKLTNGSDMNNLIKNGRTTFVGLKIHPNNEKNIIHSKPHECDQKSEKNVYYELEERIATLTEVNHELEQFAHVCSHDLREPLRTINNFIQLLSHHSFDDTTKKYFDHILSSSKRMDSLVNDILSYTISDRLSHSQVDVDVNEVVNEIIDDLSYLISETGAHIVYGTLPIIKANRTQIIRLFKNMLENSIKFRSKAAPKIQIKAESKSDYWYIQISDNGIGIAKEHYETIFDMFKRVDDSRFGSGIGLNVCKKIVEQHGGNIWVRSNLGEGSTFHFTIAKSS